MEKKMNESKILDESNPTTDAEEPSPAKARLVVEVPTNVVAGELPVCVCKCCGLSCAGPH